MAMEMAMEMKMEMEVKKRKTKMDTRNSGDLWYHWNENPDPNVLLHLWLNVINDNVLQLNVKRGGKRHQ